MQTNSATLAACCFRCHGWWQSHLGGSKSQHSSWEMKATCLEWEKHLISNQSSCASCSCHHQSSVQLQHLENWSCCIKHPNKSHVCCHPGSSTAGTLLPLWGLEAFLDTQTKLLQLQLCCFKDLVALSAIRLLRLISFCLETLWLTVQRKPPQQHRKLLQVCPHLYGFRSMMWDFVAKIRLLWQTMFWCHENLRIKSQRAPRNAEEEGQCGGYASDIRDKQLVSK